MRLFRYNESTPESNLCLRDGTPVYRDFELSTSEVLHGLFIRNGQYHRASWDNQGENLEAPGPDNILCFAE